MRESIAVSAWSACRWRGWFGLSASEAATASLVNLERCNAELLTTRACSKVSVLARSATVRAGVVTRSPSTSVISLSASHVECT